MLYFLANAQQNNIRDAKAIFALYYNPYFPEHYRWPFTKQIMDMETEVLIGGEFWDFVGGPGTYDELLCILSEVKQELRVQ
ncbi:MAG: TdeIII family type II restriction endonuclease [Dehalococcoidia bacterium]